jgi:hypothetical protein
MEHPELDWNALLWAGGWLGAVLAQLAQLEVHFNDFP